MESFGVREVSRRSRTEVSGGTGVLQIECWAPPTGWVNVREAGACLQGQDKREHGGIAKGDTCNTCVAQLLKRCERGCEYRTSEKFEQFEISLLVHDGQ